MSWAGNGESRFPFEAVKEMVNTELTTNTI
jgi:hypothetical protein